MAIDYVEGDEAEALRWWCEPLPRDR